MEVIIILIFNILKINGVAQFFENTNRFEDYLIGLIVTLIYYIPLESISSRSIAKYITGTIVVMEDGSKPDSQTILKRTFCRLIPFDILSFFGSPSRGWHDTMSDTYVVKKAAFEESKKMFYEFEEIGKEINE